MSGYLLLGGSFKSFQSQESQFRQPPAALNTKDTKGIHTNGTEFFCLNCDLYDSCDLHDVYSRQS